ncbi:MAG: glycosyltransferase family 4 protein [Dehalococcoidia bacterium]|nr:glycosyltransferase family 4 protein [Dehalococcoidia bacterium]
MADQVPSESPSLQNLKARFSPRVRLVQFISDLSYGDAASSDCMETHQLLQQWGFQAVVCADRVDRRHQSVARHFSSYRPRKTDFILFHYSAWSGAAQFLLELGKPLLLMYHNITPPEFFRGTDPVVSELTRKGLEALPRFAPLAVMAIAKSEYSRKELDRTGFERTGVMPILVDFQRLDGETSQQVLRAYDDDCTNLLFVGRVVPNKRQEDIIKTFYYYHQRCNPRSRLFLVGSHMAVGPYLQWLRKLVDELDLGGWVHFTGQISYQELLSFYRLADVFLCMSEHEGFCVPIVESMYLGIPVIAYAAAAAPFTMGQGGILVKQKDYGAIAELVHLLVNDRALRDRLVSKGRERAQDFSRENVERQFASHLEQALINWESLS